MWKKIFLLSFILCLFITLVGCGGGGNPIIPPIPEPEAIETIVPETSKVVEEETIEEIVSITEDQSTIVFKSSTPQLEELAPGDIIAMGVTENTPEGLLRKVTKVTKGVKDSSEVVIETEFATLEEAIEQGDFSFNEPLKAEDAKEPVCYVKGIEFIRDKSKIKDSKMQLLEFNFKIDAIILDGDNNPDTKEDNVTLIGQISFDYNLSLSGKIRWFKLKELNFQNIVKVEKNLGITVGGSVELFSYEKTLFTQDLGIKVISIGCCFPVVLHPIIIISANVDGEITADITAEITDTDIYTAGIQFDNGSWQPISSHEDSHTPPSLSLSTGGSVTFSVGPKLECKVDGVVGPYCKTTLYGKVIADIYENPWWKIYAGIIAKIGVKIEIFSKTFASADMTLFPNLQILLAQADGPFINPNHPPEISSLTANPSNINMNETTAITCTAFDEDVGDILTYTWTKNGGTFEGITSGSTITWRAPSTADTYTVTCDVSDGNGGEATKLVDISVSNITPTNQSPFIPNNPSPISDSTSISINTNLSWIGGDPDPEDTVTYDVYFEANDSTPDILVSNDQSSTIYNPGILNYDTHYYWKIIAKDNHGNETLGPVWIFITESQINNPPNLPNTPSGPSSGITGTSYSFSASTTDPDGDNIAYMFDWGDGNIANWTSYVSSGNIVNQLHSYSTKGTYYIKVKAKDVNGAESLWSNSRKIIIDLEITKPVAPSKLSATTLSQNNIALVWQDNANNETGFKIERKTGITGTFLQIATIGATAGSGSGVYYEDSELIADTTYCYRIKAYNSAGDSLDSNQDCDTTKPISTFPSATTNSATNITFNSVTLNGTVNPNGVETGAFFQWGTTTSYGNITDSQLLGNGTSNVNISTNLNGLSPNTIYHFRIVATNSNSGTTFGGDQLFTTTYNTQNVTLILYIYENSTSGPPLSGVSIGIVDGGGNSFSKITNSSGYVTITGIPGTWYFSASKSGYDTNSWNQSITTNCTKYGYIVKSATPVGTIDVFAKLDGSYWFGSLSYSLTGPSASSGSTVSAVLSNKPVGSYSIAFNSGGPSNASLSSITPSSTQTLSEGGIIAFTFNFVTQKNKLGHLFSLYYECKYNFILG